ncbi:MULTISPECIES: transposase [Rhizobium]|uniref:Transposase n=1 Tax=Rhizobium rhizogenes NBRC 13257 TaxID=1220581 RepID=A0AA87U6C5_RHIRH|nr:MULTISPECIES: transposase [Rhizobium]MBO9126438.1 transposase [Rhizobium sp. 16-488-2b]MBO9178373.1 transposase [Rhizobium sp. 16-488-2a]MBO9194918.1 transposase [Rhizobium sp. 16-449-1b]NTG71318.1 transposase [Rhizobium rhizogenes]NTH68657.1 transposase [Rhizobium rhizogenes]
MADEEIQIPPDGTVAAEIEPDAPESKRAKKVRAETSHTGSFKLVEPKTRGRSNQEKLEMIGQVEAQVAGGVILKDAVKIVGISNQTYYQWKRAMVQPVSQRPAVSVSGDDELAEFTQLEEENRRLRKLLSEKLRAENSDLRKRLGMN